MVWIPRKTTFVNGIADDSSLKILNYSQLSDTMPTMKTGSSQQHGLHGALGTPGTTKVEAAQPSRTSEA